MAGLGMLCAQDFPKLHFTAEDGLPSNTVYSCFRDSRGFMWLTTDKGIVRYNGERFEVYNTFNGLPDNEVFSVGEDLQGRIWLGTYSGSLCYIKDDKFYSAANTPFLRVKIKGQVTRKINVEADSSITIQYGGAAFTNIKNEKARYYELNRYSFDERRQVMAVSKLSPTTFRIIGSEKADVVRFSDTGYSIVSSTRNSHLWDSCGKGKIGRWHAVGAQGQIYLFGKCFIYDRDWNVLRQFFGSFHDKYFLHQIYRTDNNWFMATDRGVLVNDSLQLLQGNSVTCISQGREGNYWCTTLNDGVFVFSKSYLFSRMYEHAYTGSIKYTKAINGQLFFIDEKSDVFMLNNEKGEIKCLFRYANYFDKEPQFSYPAFYIDSNYKLFYTSNKKAFTVENLLANNPIIRKIPSDLPAFYSLKKIYLLGDMMYINAGFKVVATSLTNMGLKVANYRIVGDTSSSEKIFAYCQDSRGGIWYSTLNGVFKVVKGVPVIQPQIGTIAFKAFAFLGDHLVGYTHNNDLLFCTDLEGKTVIDTVRSQNCIWDKLNVIDGKHLFITTNNWDRILEVRREKGNDVPVVTTIENRFLPLRAEAVAFDNHTGFFFKSGTITVQTAELLYHRASAPRLFFTTVNAGGKSYGAQGPLELPFSSSRNLIISFTTVSFSGNKVAYQYSLSRNGNETWIDLKEEQINVANPGYGVYTVKIRARTMSSDYSRPEILTLTILRPFWATWWFITIVVCMILAVLWLLLRYRIASELKTREAEHDNKVKFMKAEYKSLNALMNPHFIFNTLNNVQSLVNRDDKRAANEYLRIFADLIRQNMHNVSNELIPLEKEMNLVSNYLLLEKLRFKENLHYSINVDESVDLSEIWVPPLLIQPLVENSIKHGILPMESAEGKVEVNVFEEGSVLYIEVRDNGAGLTRTESNAGVDSHISFGLENIKKRVEQLSIIQNRQIFFDIGEVQEADQRWTVAKVSMSL
jgi:two-component sensor histidine kinase